MLTAVGRRFVDNAKQMLELADEFDQHARDLKETPTGGIEIGCFTPTAPFVIPIVLQRLKRDFPEITLKLHEGDIDEIYRLLNTGVIEVALTYDMYPSPTVDFEPLTEAYPYALLAADDPLAQASSVSLADLADRDMIAFDLPITQQYFHALFIQQNLRPKIRHQVKSYEMVRSLVGAGEGYSVLIMRPANERTYSGDRLAYLPHPDGDFSAPLRAGIYQSVQADQAGAEPRRDLPRVVRPGRPALATSGPSQYRIALSLHRGHASAHSIRFHPMRVALNKFDARQIFAQFVETRIPVKASFGDRAQDPKHGRICSGQRAFAPDRFEILQQS